MKSVKNNHTLLLNVNLKNILLFLHSCFMLNQKVLIYYDIVDSSCPSDYALDYLMELCFSFKKLGVHVQYFIDFIPGFISNTFGKTFASIRPDFNVFLFLNFNHHNASHAGIVNELAAFKYEYLLVSPIDIDTKRFSPYAGVSNLNLNLPSFFDFFFYLLQTVYQYIENYKFKRDHAYFKLCFAIYLLKREKKTQPLHYLSFTENRTPFAFLEMLEPYYNRFYRKYQSLLIAPREVCLIDKGIELLRLQYAYYYYQVFYSQAFIDCFLMSFQLSVDDYPIQLVKDYKANKKKIIGMGVVSLLFAILKQKNSKIVSIIMHILKN